jgi:hypothetical protein
MRRLGIALVLVLAAGAASAHDTWYSSDGEDCSGRHIRFDGEPAAVEQEVIEAGNLRSLKAAVSHAPISVRGGASTYRITVCKAAARASDLAAIHVNLDGNELKATGPRGRRWTVQYFIEVPHGADLDLEAKNGPIALRDVEGTVVARAANGPLSLRNLSGNVDVQTTNGPISIRGGSGTMKVRASNGPLTVDLDGHAWQGGTLDAATKNGPLSLKLPRNYASGVTVETSGRGPISCRAEGCRRNYRTMHDDDRWNDHEPRTSELGRGSPAVKLSTVNGPVTIKDE